MTQDRIEPVSYTHLDVYKRQVQILEVFRDEQRLPTIERHCVTSNTSVNEKSQHLCWLSLGAPLPRRADSATAPVHCQALGDCQNSS